MTCPGLLFFTNFYVRNVKEKGYGSRGIRFCAKFPKYQRDIGFPLNDNQNSILIPFNWYCALMQSSTLRIKYLCIILAC